MSTETIVSICIQVLGLGIFIGMQRSHNAAVTERLKKIESNQDRTDLKIDKQNEEMVAVRERVAVIESVLEIKRAK